MSRDVPLDEKAICDICGKVGAYDFMGNFLRPEYVSKTLVQTEACNRCGHMPCICGE